MDITCVILLTILLYYMDILIVSRSLISHWSKFCKWNMFRVYVFFICVRWSKFFSRSPYFCSKISSGGPYLQIRWGTNLGGPFLPWQLQVTESSFLGVRKLRERWSLQRAVSLELCLSFKVCVTSHNWFLNTLYHQYLNRTEWKWNRLITRQFFSSLCEKIVWARD